MNPRCAATSRGYFKLEGYNALAAEDGRAGLEAVRKQHPDLILCDVMMPVMDGHEVLRALRTDENLHAIPFIFLTAKGEKSDQRGGMNLGADDYLTKPVENEDLIEAVAARLQRAEQTAHAELDPRFSRSQPLEQLGLSPREAEVLLWASQAQPTPRSPPSSASARRRSKNT